MVVFTKSIEINTPVLPSAKNYGSAPEYYLSPVRCFWLEGMIGRLGAGRLMRGIYVFFVAPW